METAIECLTCFMRQGFNSAELVAPDDKDMQFEIFQAWATYMAGLGPEDLHRTPPDLAEDAYALTARISGNNDPYKETKLHVNKRVLELLPRLREIIHSSEDALSTALHFSIIGNYIDSGAPDDYDWEHALENEQQSQLTQSTYSRFMDELKPDARVLIVGDNAGEIAIDTLLVQELQSRGCHVTYTVRESAIINDALMEDAEFVGMTKLCPVISTGTASPGAVLPRCSKEFLEQLRNSDVRLCKGQGNFEAMHGAWPNTYFALKAKCRVVAQLFGVEKGTSMFLYK